MQSNLYLPVSFLHFLWKLLSKVFFMSKLEHLKQRDMAVKPGCGRAEKIRVQYKHNERLNVYGA